MQMNYEEHFDKSAEIRNEFWSKIGTVHPDVVTHIINPAFMGGPAWPSIRQAFLKIDTPTGTIIATDGLSDPYSDFDENPDNQKYNGIGCEFYIECDELIEQFEALRSSWQFHVLYQAAQLAADNANISGVFDKYTYLSTELYDTNLPDEFINADGRAAVLMGLPSSIVSSRLELSLETVRMVNVKLLTLKELEHIVKNGTNGRNEVVEFIQKQDKPSKSFLERPSVI